MKRILIAEDYKRAISTSELEKAAFKCRHGISWKGSTIRFFENLLWQLERLSDDLAEDNYKILPYLKFPLAAPKPRFIQATKLPDRVVQRSLCDNGLYDIITRTFMYDNIACQRGKGLTAGIKRAGQHLRNYYHKYGTNEGWYLKLDIHHYFDSTPRELLKESVARVVKQKDFVERCFQIIDSFDDRQEVEGKPNDGFGPRGVGLGSQCSQLFQLLYLSPLDHKVIEQFGIKEYVRYMDDILIVVPKRRDAVELFHEVDGFVKKKGLSLNPKSHLGPLTSGLKFLKTSYKLTKTGGVKTGTLRSNISKEIHRLNSMFKKLLVGELEIEDLIQHGNTWSGFALERASKEQIDYVKTYIKDLFLDFHYPEIL